MLSRLVEWLDVFGLSLKRPCASDYDLNVFREVPFTAKRSRPVREGTMDLILAKALELFRKRGLEVTTMRDIADAAGVASGAAYYYFESKEAMVAPTTIRFRVCMRRRPEKSLSERKDCGRGLPTWCT